MLKIQRAQITMEYVDMNDFVDLSKERRVNFSSDSESGFFYDQSDESVVCKRGDTILNRAGFQTRELVQNDETPSVDTGTPLLGETQIYN